jgi:hypothetical protein
MESIQLMGTEAVERAGRNMVAAAESMSRTQGYTAEAQQRHEVFMDEWLSRFTTQVDRIVITMNQS